MFGISGSTFNPLNFVSQAALATATGGTSLLVQQLTQQLVSAIGQQVIQQFGQQLGLPQPLIDAAQGAFAGSVGDFQGASSNYQEALGGIAEAFPNASPADLGQAQRGADEAYNAAADWAKSFIENASQQDSEGNVRGGGSRGGGAPSWLMAIAKGLAHMLNVQSQKLEDKMNSTNWDKAGEAAEFQAQSQEFGLAMNTATNAIKTIGDALSTMARKN